MKTFVFLIPPGYRLNKEMVVPMDTKRHEAHKEALQRIRLANKNSASEVWASPTE